jgi:flagellar protein FlgJ
MIDAGAIVETRGLDRLKMLARDDAARALPEVVREFEAEFMRMMLKSMRETKLAEDPLENDAARMYRDMFDAEVSRSLAHGPGMGLRDALLRQLSGQIAAGSGLPPPNPPPQAGEGRGGGAVRPVQSSLTPHAAAREDFIRRLWPHAEAASRVSGVPARYIVAHAALESGWGRHEPRAESGLPSHNLFGIKAGKTWDGMATEAGTSEYQDGRWQRQPAQFRAYTSYAEGFADYAHMLRDRFGITPGMDEEGFARRLQDGGYATDPAYADKLTRVLGSDVLRAALAASG